jgi:hypothetical protein
VVVTKGVLYVIAEFRADHEPIDTCSEPPLVCTTSRTASVFHRPMTSKSPVIVNQINTLSLMCKNGRTTMNC